MNARDEAKRGHRSVGRGFTLIDLTLTLFIIGLFAAIAMPRYGMLVARFEADAVAEQVAADLRFARHQARLKGNSRTVEFDPVANRYELLDVAHIDRPELPYRVELASLASTGDIVSASFGDSGNETRVVFDLYGRPDAGGSLRIQVGGNQRTIRVEGTTGNVEVQP